MRTPFRFYLITLVLSFLFTTLAFGANFQYTEYTVKKGDTLWKITRAHLQDSFQWPMIWKENLSINNPDLIYPGQKILIPIGLLEDGDEPMSADNTEEPDFNLPQDNTEQVSAMIETPEDEAEEPAPIRKPQITQIASTKVIPIVSRQVLIESGYITKFMPSAGSVAGSPVGRNAFGLNDPIYINTQHPAQVGQKFYAIKKLREVLHPETGVKLGFLMKVMGTIRVDEAGTKGLKATVVESFDIIETTDFLDYYNEMIPPFAPESPRKPQVDGYILNSSYLRLISGGMDIVFLDKGMDDGLEIGDLIMSLMAKTDDTVNSVIQVVNVRNKTSLAVVLKSRHEVSRGDKIIGFNAE